MPGSRIVALGHYQPARVLTNEELAQMVETSDEWIQSRVGIKTRRIADDETVADMAAAAAGKALANSELSPSDIDLVVVATLTAEDRCPNVAARVAETLGIKAVAAYDLNTACSGFVYALATVDHAIQAGVARNALVIGAERLSKFVDWTDRSTCVLLGDGAGAAVVSASDEPAISPVLWGSVPEMGHTITIDGEPQVFKQEGQAVFRWATTELPKLARAACEKAGISPSELAAFVPHQANLRIIEPLAKKLGAENAIVARDVVDSGNTSAASVPLALAKLVERREVPSGAPVLLLGFGGGVTYAGLVIRCP
ncbi:beta-ketoacyl-ACP synthase III [Tenggerimyces flavus]|uniref:Beta-ketoacyl-[acyl-carrier-protein] synthase III n=1 Tax=Tenggerimyces flavus TaxID=1708749 RepID=A0ABV7YLL4_9ACTN|nr:beta-ketoacyl-ACP synthase III [Tenggerimyces flavus]MBM7789493.1 3-oxoacyl-[acyl-carrier-protein] synthase-3 [Tenggerimyces flavus]